MFPKHNIIEDNEIAKKNLRGKEIKRIEFAPMFYCEFFEGMEVIQMQSKKTNEYVFGIYWCCRLVGHCYFGNLYDANRLQEIIRAYMPPTLEDVGKYDLEFGSEIWYYRYTAQQYAWIYQNVITKINN